MLRAFGEPAWAGSLQAAQEAAVRETNLRRSISTTPGAFYIEGESPARYVHVAAHLQDGALLTLDLRYARSRHARYGPAAPEIVRSFRRDGPPSP